MLEHWHIESCFIGEPSGPRAWQGQSCWPTREAARDALDAYCDANGYDPSDFTTMRSAASRAPFQDLVTPRTDGGVNIVIDHPRGQMVWELLGQDQAGQLEAAIARALRAGREQSYTVKPDPTITTLDTVWAAEYARAVAVGETPQEAWTSAHCRAAVAGALRIRSRATRPTPMEAHRPRAHLRRVAQARTAMRVSVAKCDGCSVRLDDEKPHRSREIRIGGGVQVLDLCCPCWDKALAAIGLVERVTGAIERVPEGGRQ